MLMFVGGCSGSTGGGIKVIRLVTLLKQGGINEMKYLVHPRGIFIIRLSGNTVKKRYCLCRQRLFLPIHFSSACGHYDSGDMRC